MKWWNLRKNKCPKCGDDLFSAEGESVVNCSNSRCSFKIGLEKFNSIIMDQNKRDVEDRTKEEEDNQTALNNL